MTSQPWLQLALLLAAARHCACQQFDCAARPSSGAQLPINVLVPLPRSLNLRFPDSMFNPFNLTIAVVKPVVHVAVADVYARQILAPGALTVRYKDTNNSDRIGPMVTIDAYWCGVVDLVLGYANIYALAPIARYSSLWGGGVPVVSTVGDAATLDSRDEYPLLTRIRGGYRAIGTMLFHLLGDRAHPEVAMRYFNQFTMIVNDPAHIQTAAKTIPVSQCSFVIRALHHEMLRASFDEHWDIRPILYQPIAEMFLMKQQIREYLIKASNAANDIAVRHVKPKSE